MAELAAQKREIFGRRTKQLRREGLLPAELYGRGIENVHLSIPADAFSSVYKEAGEHTIVNIVLDKGGSRPVLIHDVRRDSLTSTILAVDFYQVRMDEKVTTHVPIDFTGESPAVRDNNVILVKVMDELEVEALPGDIPSSIVVDLSALVELNQSIYVKDIAISSSFVINADPESVIASVSEQREEEVELVKELTPEDVVVEGEEKRAQVEGESQEKPGDEQGKEAKT